MENTKSASPSSPLTPNTRPRTLLVLAGGIGSRYGSLKQIDGITPYGESLLEFSVFDALATGFNKFVFVINRRIPAEFIARLSTVLAQRQAQAHWIVQELNTGVPTHLDYSDRQKPWGTGHALLCAQEAIAEPFTVINADDFYGRELYRLAIQALISDEVNASTYQLLAFPVATTLSKQGGVSRGICHVSNSGMLTSISEQHSLQWHNGAVEYEENGRKKALPPNWPVSMNCWVFTPSIFSWLRALFEQFIGTVPSSEREFYIPAAVQNLLAAGNIQVRVQLSPSRWMGVTHASDKEELVNFIQQEIACHRYPTPLWN